MFFGYAYIHKTIIDGFFCFFLRWTIDTSAMFSLFNEGGGDGESGNPGDFEDREVQNILNAAPEGLVFEDRLAAFKAELSRSNC